MTDETLPPARIAVPAWKRRLETSLLASAGPILGFLLGADDPFFASGRFFWPLLGPVVAGLRYGAASSLGASALLLTGLAGFRGLGGQTGELAAGTLALALVAGEFGDRWQRRLERLDRVTRADHLRTARLSRALAALELSHARLAADRVGLVEPLAEALDRFERHVRESVDSVGAWHGDVLSLLAAHASLQVARFHPVAPDGRLLAAAAALGPPFVAGDDDPIVADALRRRELVCVDVAREAVPGPVVAALPLVDAARAWVGLVVVHELPYEGLRPSAMQAAATLCGRLADLVSGARFEAGGGGVAGPRLVTRPPEISDDTRFVGHVGT